MYDKLLCWHEAGHAVIGAALGLRHVARVKENGEGFVSWDDGALSALDPFDRAVVAVSGNVAESMAIDGNIKRAVSDTLTKDSTDAAIFQMAVRELPAWRYSPHGPALAAAAKARSIILQNREAFDELVDQLEADGIGRVPMEEDQEDQVAPVPVDYTANLTALRGQAAGLAELRSLASKVASEGNGKLAKLIEQTAARREGRSVTPVTEFSVGGPAKVVLQGEVI